MAETIKVKPQTKPTETPHANGVKHEESKADKFRRLAQKRVARAIKVLSHVAALANRRNYDRTPEQTEKVKAVITDAYRRLTQAYDDAETGQTEFTL